MTFLLLIIMCILAIMYIIASVCTYLDFINTFTIKDYPNKDRGEDNE